MDFKPDQQFDTINSILMVGLETNVLLNTCLDVLIAMHLDGKPENEKEVFLQKVSEKMATYRKDTKSFLMPIRKP